MDVGDRGLLAIELAPDFPAEPYLYALYTYDHVLDEPLRPTPAWEDSDGLGEPCDPAGAEGVDSCPVSGRLVRIAVEEDHAGSEQVMLEGWCQQDSSHSIGDLGFGPEGALFVSGGEGASFVDVDYGQYGWPHANQCGDPPGEGGALRAQDARTPADPTGLSGALLRIDPETTDGWVGNPMAGSSDANLGRIIAYGLRNPYRFAVDGATGSVFVANVGWGDEEEIDQVPIGAGTAYNSGWPCYEGDAPQPAYASAEIGPCQELYEDPGSTSLPFFFYDHAGSIAPGEECPTYNGSAVAGLAIYHGGQYPARYDGALFFADTVRGCMYVMRAGEDGDPDPSEVEPFLTDASPYPGVDLIEGPEGDLYYASLESPEEGLGGIHRISFDSKAPEAKLTADQTSGPAPLEVTFDAGGSTPSEESGPAGELEFEWDLDGNGSFETDSGTSATETETYEGSENVTVSIRVTDKGTGVSGVAELTLYPDDESPEVEIDNPVPGLTWGVGQEIGFDGGALEFGGAAIPWERLYWKTRILHCPFGEGCHRHPLRVFPATSYGTVVAPEHDYPSSIEVSLTATDKRGLTATQTVAVAARPVTIELASEPPGIDLTAGSRNDPAPFSLEAVEDSTITLSAPATATVGGVQYAFREWSDGGARVHSLSARESAGYTAVYGLAEPEPGSQPGQVGAPPAAEGPESSAPGAGTPAVPRPRFEKHPSRRTHRRTARFVFGATSASGVTFHCRLGGHKPWACRSPLVLRHLRVGRHKLRIWVSAEDGRRGRARVFGWRVLPRHHASRVAHRRG